MAAGRRMGYSITRAHAVAWMTRNPAYALGILDQTGTLEKNKDADVVVWDGDPFSVYTHAEKVFIDGALLYDRDNPKISPRSDFELGREDIANTRGAGQ
jgi:imidazolonepropionase-like amidohydrolase